MRILTNNLIFFSRILLFDGFSNRCIGEFEGNNTHNHTENCPTPNNSRQTEQLHEII